MRNNVSNYSAIKDSRVIANSSRNELPLIKNGEDILVDARILHKQLNSSTRFNDWFQRRKQEFGFEDGIDYYSNLSNQKNLRRGGNRIPTVEYHLTLDMAKELAMVERNEVGRQIRKYFIEAEKELRNKRLYAQSATITELNKQLKPIVINNRKMYPLRQVRELLGFNPSSGTSSIRTKYSGLYIVMSGRGYVSEEYVRILMCRATTRSQEAQASQASQLNPVLPHHFGQLSFLAKGGSHE